MPGDLDPLAAAGDHREHRRPGGDEPHVMLELRHVVCRRSLNWRPDWLASFLILILSTSSTPAIRRTNGLASLAPLLDRLTHHVHILEMKAKAISSPRASVGPARRSIRQRQIKKHYQRQRAHRPHNNDRSARALAVKPAPAARRYAGQSSTARRDRAMSSVRRMSAADAQGAVMHFLLRCNFIPAWTLFGRCHAPSAFTLRAFERPGRVRR